MLVFIKDLSYVEVAPKSVDEKEIKLKTSISGTKVNNLPLFPMLSKYSSYLKKWYSISICFITGLIYFRFTNIF